jgi:hypothetical protein
LGRFNLDPAHEDSREACDVILLFDQPLILFFIMLAALFLVVEIGRVIGKQLSVNEDTLRHEQLVASRDAIGILMSLLLGFTLAMALSRYDQRKQLMVDEANAIGTASLRTTMLPDLATREKMLELLREYVEARNRFSRAALDGQQMTQSIEQTKKLQNQMWLIATDVARSAPTSITSLFVQSLNEMMDLSEKRMSLLENRVPPPIWIMLTLIAILTCLTVGMTVRRRFWYAMMVTPLMISIVMALIADLNSPRSGFLQTGHQSMERLEQDLNAR